MTGTTAPNAKVDVDVVNIDIDGAADAATTTAAADGSFSIPVTTPAGHRRHHRGRHRAERRDRLRAGDRDLRLRPRDADASTCTDPAGDDNGPGTYAYPTSDNFHAGAYDLQRFQVYDSGADTVTFRVQAGGPHADVRHRRSVPSSSTST